MKDDVYTIREAELEARYLNGFKKQHSFLVRVAVILGVTIAGLLILWRLFGDTVNVDAAKEDKVKLAYCHADSGKKGFTYHFNSAWDQHFLNNGSPKAGHEGDFFTYEGDNECSGEEPEITLTPTPDVTLTPAPEITLTPTPEITPEVTPIPENTPVRESKPEGCTHDCGVPACTDTVPKEVANPHIYRNGECALVKWYPTEGDKVNIYWKDNSSNEWQHSLIGSPNDGYEEICALSGDVTFGVQSVNGCAADGVVNASTISSIVDGNTSSWVLFR